MPEIEDDAIVTDVDPDQEEETEGQSTEATEDRSDSDDEPLREPGKKALEAEKERRKKLSRDLAEARKRIAELEEKLSGNDADSEKAAIEREALRKANERILKAEIRAAATGKLADPNDALVFLNLADFHVGPDGEVDVEAISDAIAELTRNKPHLAAQSVKRFQGTGDNGAVRKSGVKQVTAEELKTMTPEQIVKARAEGRLKRLLGNDD